MNRTLATGLLTFSIAYLALGLATAAGLDAAHLRHRRVAAAINHLLVVPAAVLLGLRLGRLNVPGVAACSLLLALMAQMAVVVILDAVARQGGGHVAWSALYRSPQLTGTVMSSLAMVASPIVWLLVLRRLKAIAPRTHTLRGAA